MSGRLKKAAVVVLIALIAVQFIRPDRENPPSDPSKTIQGLLGSSSELGAILGRSCRDCHSNETVWPWYTEIAPISWLMALGVKEGRKAVNFSNWGGYPPAQRKVLLTLSCRDVTAGKMPGPYALLHPETALSAADIETICAAAGRSGADTAPSA